VGAASRTRYLQEALRLASVAAVPRHILREAARELVDLIDSPAPDRRRLVTYHRARQIDKLRADGLKRHAICTRLGITVHQYDFAVRESHTAGVR
jgi:hypothetical protein